MKPSKQKLQKLYVDDGQTMQKLADRFGCARSTIYVWLKDYNISTRSRAEHDRWNKNKTKKDDPRLAQSAQKRLKTLDESGWFVPWNKGLTKNTDSRVAENGKSISIANQGRPIWNKDQKLSEEHKSKLSLAKGGTGRPGENRGYGPGFTEALREQVRMRDGYKCQVCGCSQVENGQSLDVHHIDYDKYNNNINNLVALCMGCHRSTNVNREYWMKYFRFTPTT